MDVFFNTLYALSADFFYYVIATLFALLSLITLHEYGHYWVARRCGVRIKKFSVGFGRELCGFTDREGVRWCLSLWPAGGYVEIFGDYDVENPKMWDKEKQAVRSLTQEEYAVAFCSKSVWQRMAIVLAGPAINFFPAVLLMALIFSFYGQASSPPVINGIDIGAAGYEAGFQLGDRVLALDGRPVRRFEDVHDRTMKEFDHPMHFKILRDGTEMNIDLQPREEKYTDIKGVERSNGRIGMANFRGLKFKDIVAVDGIDTDKQPDKARALLMARLDKTIKVGTRYRNDAVSTYLIAFPAKFNAHLSDPKDNHYDTIYTMDIKNLYYVQLGLFESINRTFSNIMGLPLEVYKIISARIAGKNDEQIIAGIGKMSSLVAESAKEGPYAFILFLCIFSVQLAIINILPIPVLDGGYMVFLIIEAARRKPVSQKIQNFSFIIGVVLLVGIMIIANVSDMIQFLR